MAFFGNLKRILTTDVRDIFNLSLSDKKAWNPSLWNLIGSQSLSGEVVTEETALTYSAVWNAVTLLAGTTGSLPLNLMKSDGRDEKIAFDKPVYRVLHSRFNPLVTAMAGREFLHTQALLTGNGYAEKVRDRYGDIVELWPLPSNRVKPDLMEDKSLVYRIRIGTEEKILSREQILHVPGIGFDGFMGYSVVEMARKSIGLGMAMETFGSLYFGQGTHPGVIVSHPQSLSPAAHSNLKKSLTESYSGLGKAHRLLLLEEGMKMEKVSISPEDSQFLESRQFQIPEIARWFNLPPHKLKDLTKSSFNNIESEQASFVTDSILPWLVRIEQNLNMQLLSDQEIKDGYYFNHIIEGLLRANSKDRAEFYRTMIGTGTMTPNEVRKKENMNPIDDPFADELWMPTGLIPMSKFEDYLAKNSGAKMEQTENSDQEDDPKGRKNLKLIGIQE